MKVAAFIEKLLDGAEVEWVALGEIGQVRMCKRILKNQTSSTGDVPFYKIGTFGREPDAFISRDLFNEYKSNYSYPKIGEILISASGTIGRTVIFDGKDAYFQDSNIVWIAHDESLILNNYLFYCYQVVNWGASDGGTISRLYNDNLRKVRIPIPSPDNPAKSLDIQRKLVQILDKFTAHNAELSAELAAREKQYDYYLNKLLSFEENEVEWIQLSEVVLPTRNIKWSEEDGVYRYIDLTSVDRENHSILETTEITADTAPSRAQRLVESGDVIFATTRPTQLRLCVIDDVYSGEVVSTGYCVLRPNTKIVLSRWIYYHLCSARFLQYVEDNESGSAYPSISDSAVKKFKIPLPFFDDIEKSLAEQARIVAILDKFDALTRSITEGLPREIELRQKQYEYYRDRLLDFTRP